MHTDMRPMMEAELIPFLGDSEAIPTSIDELVSSLRPRMQTYVDFFAQNPVREGIERSDVLIRSSVTSGLTATGEYDVPVCVHRQIERDEAPVAAYIWLHGGGYIAGSPYQDVVGSDQVANDTSCVVFGVNYRKAPEDPYPAALNDAFGVLEYIIEHALELGIDPTRIAVGGASAGAGLAAALSLLARDRGISLSYQHLLYPMIDDRQRTPSSQWTVPVWSHETNTLGWKAYLGELYGTKDVSPYAAPARSIDLRGLPPTYMHVGMLDGFLHENLQYTADLCAAGVPTEFHVYPGGPHAFDMVGSAVDVSKRANDAARASLIRALK
jgi:acetyl esterase/lipase